MITSRGKSVEYFSMLNWDTKRGRFRKQPDFATGCRRVGYVVRTGLSML